MNKISKKIVALVTMAAFVLTLVPAAAFAEKGKVEQSTASAVAVNGEKATVSIKVSDTDLDETANLVVWATKKDADKTEAIAQNAITGVTYGNVWYGDVQGEPENPNWNDAVVLAKPAAADQVVSVDVTFAEEGDYTIYAALNEKTATDLNGLQIIKSYAFTRDAESDRSKSDFGVVENNKVKSTETVDVNEEFDATFLINDALSDMTTTPLPSTKADAQAELGAHLFVWAIDNETKDTTSYFKINGNTVGVNNAIDLGQVVNRQDVTVTFTRDGNYTLYAGVGADLDEAMNNKLKNATTITVNDNTEIYSMTLDTNKGDFTDEDQDNNMFTLDLTDGSFLFNGSDVCTVSGTVTEKDGTPAKYQDLSFSTSRTDVIEFVKDSANTGNDGKFTLKFSMQSQKNGTITIKDEKTGTEYTIRIIASVTSAQDIDRTANNGTILAGDDDYWTDYNRFFDDAVGFVITDDKGDAVTGNDAIANEPAANALDADHDTYVRIMEKPSKSTLTADDLKLVANGDEYTLYYVGNDPDNDLIAGEYTVRVSLLSNDNATVSFTAKAFGKVSDVEIGLAAVYVSDMTWVFDYAIDDEVVLGTNVRVTPLYVDENGIKMDAAANGMEFTWYADSDAHAVVQNLLEFDYGDRVFTLKGDTIEHQTVVGSTITVTVYDMKKKQYKEKTVTVVDSYNDYDLSFDSTTGAVNDDNNVNVTVVEKDGDTANKVDGSLSAYIVKSSNEDAKVTVDTKKNVEKGKGALTIYSDKETTVKVQVVVKDKETGKLIGETLEYTVGKEDPLADRTVVMTIGSTEYVVNNNIVVGDAAPFVDSNWRTMVPIRALAESFDAEVIWNNSDRTVTINFDGATQIVMTIGDDTYTVNSAEQTMDTEPVIQGDRTYVPIRFAAEALGFSVTPLYNSNGLTGSVVFQR